MSPETIRDYLIRAEMTDGQAEALSRVFAEMATKSDLQSLRSDLRSLEERMGTEFAAIRGEMRAEFAAVRGEMKTEFAAVRGEMKTEFAAARGDARSDLAAMRADLTWKMIAVVGFFATASALFNVFVG